MPRVALQRQSVWRARAQMMARARSSSALVVDSGITKSSSILSSICMEHGTRTHVARPFSPQAMAKGRGRGQGAGGQWFAQK